jgi:hypothetical protein
MITKDDSNMGCDVLVFWHATFFCNKFMLPKRRFWKSERKFGNAFSKYFQRNVAQIEFGHPKSSFGEHTACKVTAKDSSHM